MQLSNKFEELVLTQLESFGCFMGVKHLVVYVASAKKGEKASFELLGQCVPPFLGQAVFL